MIHHKSTLTTVIGTIIPITLNKDAQIIAVNCTSSINCKMAEHIVCIYIYIYIYIYLTVSVDAHTLRINRFASS